MKKSILLLCAVCLFGCTKTQPEFCTVYLFIDVTDIEFKSASRYLSDIPLILRKMKVDTLQGGIDGGELRLFLINDLSESKSIVLQLAKGVPGLLGQNPLDRIDEIKKFAKGVRQNLATLSEEAKWQTDQSKIYQNLCRELNNLVRTNSERKIVIIYSDMLENSNLFSLYGPEVEKVHRYLQDMKLADKELRTDCQMPDLSGVEINVVTFRDKTNDERVNLASKFWSALFEQKNAKIRFDSELLDESL